MLTVPPRCRQMVDPAPLLPDDFHPHYGSVMFTRDSQAQQRHQEPTSTAVSLLHLEHKSVSLSCREVKRVFLLSKKKRGGGGVYGSLAKQCGANVHFF